MHGGRLAGGGGRLNLQGASWKFWGGKLKFEGRGVQGSSHGRKFELGGLGCDGDGPGFRGGMFVVPHEARRGGRKGARPGLYVPPDRKVALGNR